MLTDWFRSHYLLATAGISALIFLGTIGWCVDSQLTRANEATRVAQAAHEVSEAARLQLDRESIAREKELNEKITQAQDRERLALEASAQAQRRERAALDRLQFVVSQRDRDVGAIGSKSDVDLSRGVSNLIRVAYPKENRVFTVIPSAYGAEVSRVALEVFNTSLIDVIAQREQIQLLRDASTALNDQLSSLRSAHSAKSDEVYALNGRLDTLNDRFTALETSFTTLGSERDALADENKALKRSRLWGKVKTVVIGVGSIAAGILIGRSI